MREVHSLQEKGELFIERTKGRFTFETDRELALFLVAKLTEEVGELTDELLGEIKLQRPSKLEKRNPNDYKDELADVLVVLAAIAAHTNVNIDELIQETFTRFKHPGE